MLALAGSGGYTALNVFTLSGSRFLPTQGGLNNPAGAGVDGNLKTVDGVNIHKTGKNDYLGVTSSGRGISEGCFCIKRDDDVTYDRFMNNFSSGEKIGVTLLRERKPVLEKQTSNNIRGGTRDPKIIVKEIKELAKQLEDLNKKNRKLLEEYKAEVKKLKTALGVE